MPEGQRHWDMAAAAEGWELLVGKTRLGASRVKAREQRDRLPYGKWIKQGLIFATPGNVTDYEVIRAHITGELSQRFKIREIAFDPFGATEMVSKLIDEGIEMVEFRQTIQTFNEPTQKLEALVASGRIEHGGHPILRAHAEATTVKFDANENIRPVKDRHRGRIDGIVALIMAVSRAMLHKPLSDPSVSLVWLGEPDWDDWSRDFQSIRRSSLGNQFTSCQPQTAASRQSGSAGPCRGDNGQVRHEGG